MVASVFCRMYLSFGVSKVGPSTVLPRPDSSHEDNSFDGEDRGAISLVVIAFAVSALISICMLAMLLRCNRLVPWTRRGAGASDAARGVATANQQKREGEEGEADSEETICSADSVEFVVMAGEKLPTFLAHPVPAPSSVVILCPPPNLESRRQIFQ